MNANLGEYNFGGVEAISPMLEFRRIIYRDLNYNPYPRKDDMIPDEIKIKRKRKMLDIFI